jgi:hypothetical protein
MEINLYRCAELDMNKIKKTASKIFQVNSDDGKHCCYIDSEGRVYIENVYCEIEQYFIFEIGIENGVFYVIELNITDVCIINELSPDVNFYIAGLNGIAVSTELEAIEFLISKIKQFFEQRKINTEGMEECLRAALLSGKK